MHRLCRTVAALAHSLNFARISRSGRGGQFGSELLDGTGSVLGQDLQRVYKRVYDISRELLGKFARYHQTVVSHAGGGDYRVGADKCAVENRRECINIRPCALLTLEAVLLDGGVAGE